MARSKVESRSHHDNAHLHLLTNVPTKHQQPTPYGFWDIALTKFSNSRSLRQGQRLNQGQTMTLHTYTSYPMFLPSINFLHLTVSEIQPKLFPAARPTAHTDTMGENNTLTALMGCEVKIWSVNGSQTHHKPFLLASSMCWITQGTDDPRKICIGR